MKISVSAYSYGKYIKKDSKDCIGVLKCMDLAKEEGFEGFEMLGRFLDDEVTCEVVREHAEKIGLPVIAFTTDANFFRDEGRFVREEIEKVKKNVDLAVRLGVPVMRHDTTWGLNRGQPVGTAFDTTLGLLADCCREVTEYAAERGVKTCFENHGFFVQDSDRVEKLIETVGNPNFGLMLDIGNFLVVDEDPHVAVGKLAKYAFHVHAKDYHIKPRYYDNPGRGWNTTRGGTYYRGAILGHGDVYPQSLFMLINRTGYDGYVSVEFEGIEDNLLGISISHENLRRYLKALEN